MLLLLLLVPPPLMVLPPDILRFRRLLGAWRAGSATQEAAGEHRVVSPTVSPVASPESLSLAPSLALSCCYR